MINCTTTERSFEPGKRRKVTANFNGGYIASNGGVLLLHQVDRFAGLTKQVAAKILGIDRLPDRAV